MTTNIGEASTILFYGKIPAGRAALISMDYLRVQHYPKHHRPLRKCSALAQRIYERLRLDPLTIGSLRKELDMTGRPQRNRFDRALRELQVTLNIARRNRALGMLAVLQKASLVSAGCFSLKMT